jgi:hypothetical protein
MPLADDLASFRENLLEVADGCGIGHNVLKEGEIVNQITGNAGVDPDHLAKTDQDDLNRWFATFGRALTITLPDDDLVFDLNSHNRSALDPIIQNAVDLGQKINIRISIRKSLLEGPLRAALGGHEDLRIVPFFFGQRLAEILSEKDAHYGFFEEGFLQIETNPGDRRLLVLLADIPGRLQGPYLAVLGKDHLTEAARFAGANQPLAALGDVRKIAGGECVWDSRPKLLTPDFFQLDPERSHDLGDCRRELLRLQNELSIRYLAHQTVGAPGQQVSTFMGSRTVEVGPGEEKSSDDLYQLYHWTYEEPKSARTKLEIVRRVVASRLPLSAAGVAEMAQNAKGLLSEAKVQLRVLVDENVVKSFERRERVEKLVRDYADGIAKQIQALTRELVDNVYKTAGLLLGVVVAYLLKPDQGPLVLVLSVVFYALYILLIRFFYLGAIRKEHCSRKQDYGQSSGQILRFEILTEETRLRLASVGGEDKKFDRTFGEVSCIYLALAVVPLVLVAGWLIWRDPTIPPEALRASALEEQARRFKAQGYEDVHLNLKGKDLSAPLSDSTRKTWWFPDLTAVRKDGSLLALAYVPCPKIGKPDELERLVLRQSLAAQSHAELQFLTGAVCGGVPGPDLLRTWLRPKIPEPTIWAF